MSGKQAKESAAAWWSAFESAAAWWSAFASVSRGRGWVRGVYDMACDCCDTALSVAPWVALPV